MENKATILAGGVRTLFLPALLGLLAQQVCAAPTYYNLSVDDYAVLRIDGSQVASYDAYPWGYADGSVDLAPGWHSIDLTYKNRWGTSALYFSERTDPRDPWEWVPLSHLRSFDATGALVEGLRADYYAPDGALLGTLYGEGPIAHGWSNNYEGDFGKSGGAIVDQYWLANWRAFEERLTGEVYISGTAVPEPGSLALVGLACGMLAFRRRIPPTID